MTTKTSISMLITVLAACGGGVEGQPPPSTAPSEEAGSETLASAGDDGEELMPVLPTETGEDLAAVTYEPDPRLSVYVEGPDPVDPADEDDSMTNRYDMEVVLTNTGDEPVELAPTQVWFDVWKGDRRIECPAFDKQLVETPDELPAGEAFTFHADAICALPSPGEYEVRTYLSIATDEQDLDLERHFAGRHVVTR